MEKIVIPILNLLKVTHQLVDSIIFMHPSAIYQIIIGYLPGIKLLSSITMNQKALQDANPVLKGQILQNVKMLVLLYCIVFENLPPEDEDTFEGEHLCFGVL